ncbi:UTP--glucose-1-phosphate uridylyltransferase [Chlamydiales bacterium]|nr:UTP--glucose-1-phosphate uridylyltransferase [Chlamydiales bacterium]
MMTSTIIKTFPSLSSNLKMLEGEETVQKKIDFLLTLPKVKENLSLIPDGWIEKCNNNERLAFFQFLSFTDLSHITKLKKESDHLENFKEFLHELVEFDGFYQAIGGVMGYQYEVVKLLYPIQDKIVKVSHSHPKGWDITKSQAEKVLDGILSLSLCGMMFPVGGSGDRLNLRDEATGEGLPVACLPFLGKSLLEVLFSDLEALEWLHFKVFHKQLITPVAMMTSFDKSNDQQIHDLLERSQWFHRPKKAFKLFKQPLAPVVDIKGVWVMDENWKLFKKPGGHGVIWKLSEDQGVFKWFHKQGRTKGVIRQINNPVAGLDHALTTFLGIGTKEDKKFGFLSCPRRVNSPEGMNVLYQEKTPHGVLTGITNVEYTDFVKLGIEDVPLSSNSSYSEFPSNTNTLFVDFHQVSLVTKTNPFPGLVFNPKSAGYGRLESAMQNIADDFTDLLPDVSGSNAWENLSTFIAYQSREKTISVAKKSYIEGEAIHDTPVGAFYDILLNYSHLLEKCQVEIPSFPSIDQYDHFNPPFIFLFHPILGPLWSIISQKIKGGKILPSSEVHLEIAELFWSGCIIKGSLLIKATNPLGEIKRGIQTFSPKCGQCYLENVVVKNQGIDFSKENIFWKNKTYRKESLIIRLEGNSRFIAKDVVIEGDQTIVIPNGEQWTMTQDGIKKEAIKTPSFLWDYHLNTENEIDLSLTPH